MFQKRLVQKSIINNCKLSKLGLAIEETRSKNHPLLGMLVLKPLCLCQIQKPFDLKVIVVFKVLDLMSNLVPAICTLFYHFLLLLFYLDLNIACK